MRSLCRAYAAAISIRSTIQRNNSFTWTGSWSSHFAPEVLTALSSILLLLPVSTTPSVEPYKGLSRSRRFKPFRTFIIFQTCTSGGSRWPALLQIDINTLTSGHSGECGDKSSRNDCRSMTFVYDSNSISKMANHTNVHRTRCLFHT